MEGRRGGRHDAANSNPGLEIPMPTPRWLALPLVLTLALPGAARANIVVNGGFEAVLSGWSNNWSSENTIMHSGSRSAASGCQDPTCVDPNSPARSFLTQDLPTVAGGVYSLDFFVNQVGGTPNALRVYWGGTLVFAMADTPDGLGFVEHGASNLTAVGNTTTLTFLGRNDPDTVYLDDVSVLQAAVPQPVPEPGTVALVGAAVPGLFSLRRRA